jgi:hypothetical protein
VNTKQTNSERILRVEGTIFDYGNRLRALEQIAAQRAHDDDDGFDSELMERLVTLAVQNNYDPTEASFWYEMITGADS